MADDLNLKGYDEEQLLNLARIAEAAERYPDMCKFMSTLVKKKMEGSKNLSIDERNLLSVAYKNVVGSKRQSWRTLAAGNFQDLDKEIVEEYRKLVELELQTVCNEVLDLLKGGPVKSIDADGNIIEAADAKDAMSKEDGVFYLKMCGDYYRYLAEFTEESAKKEDPPKKEDEDDPKLAKNQAAAFYKRAMDMAKKDLPETHPTRLGLALNFSVCYYEILKKKDKACELAKEAFDAAIEKLDTLNDASYKDSTLIMQLLRDNLTLWTSENQDEAEDAAAQ